MQLDSTAEVVNWIRLKDYGFIDVNVLAKSPKKYDPQVSEG